MMARSAGAAKDRSKARGSTGLWPDASTSSAGGRSRRYRMPTLHNPKTLLSSLYQYIL
jgi:hypothetical protein